MPRMGPGDTVVTYVCTAVYALQQVYSKSVCKRMRVIDYESVYLASEGMRVYVRYVITSLLYALYRPIMIESYCVESE